MALEMGIYSWSLRPQGVPTISTKSSHKLTRCPFPVWQDDPESSPARHFTRVCVCIIYSWKRGQVFNFHVPTSQELQVLENSLNRLSDMPHFY